MTHGHGNWKALAACFAGAVILFLSWLLPPTAGLWQALDEAVFRGLNGSLMPHSPASRFWGLLNVRASDLIPAVMLYALGVFVAGRMEYADRMRFIHRGLALIAVMVTVITIENIVDAGLFSYHRAGPTAVFDDAVRLSEVVPGAKDFSPKSFPGDHGYVLICIAWFFALAAPRRYAVAASAIAVFFVLPRLVAGAHWMSDIVVGSGAKALLTTGWLMGSPLWDRLADRIERGLDRLPFNPVAWACRRWWGDPPQSDLEGLSADRENRTDRRAA